MKELEIKASNVEQAIEQGLAELKVGQDEVDVEIISKGGFLKKAVVKLIVKEKPIVAPAPIVAQEAKVDSQPKQGNSYQRDYNRPTQNQNPRQDKSPLDFKPKELIETPYDELEDGDKTCVDFVKKLLANMGLDCNLKVASTTDKLSILICGEDTNFAIGYRGETLDNIQYLTLLVANKAVRFKKKLIIDAEGYREKRAETLIALSRNISFKVAKTNCAVELEPMNPFERRVIHTALQNDKYVTTSSEGDEPNRYIVISPRQAEQNGGADIYDTASKQNFKKTGMGKTRSFGNKTKKF